MYKRQGLCLALVFAFRHSIEFGVDPDGMVDVILIGVVLGIVSARIFERAKQYPGKKAQLQKFMDYYLPTALKLLNTYASLPAQRCV